LCACAVARRATVRCASLTRRRRAAQAARWLRVPRVRLLQGAGAPQAGRRARVVRILVRESRCAPRRNQPCARSLPTRAAPPPHARARFAPGCAAGMARPGRGGADARICR
jgi:hypothetical protein